MRASLRVCAHVCDCIRLSACRPSPEADFGRSDAERPLPRCMHRLLLGFLGNVADFCDHPPTRILETARFAALSLSLVFRVLVVLLARRSPDCAPRILANFSRFHRQGTSSCRAVHRLSILRKLWVSASGCASAEPRWAPSKPAARVLHRHAPLVFAGCLSPALSRCHHPPCTLIM